MRESAGHVPWVVEDLCAHRDLIPELARLHFEEWGHLRPDGDAPERREGRLADCCDGRPVPSVLVAVENGRLLGSSMLVASDMDTRPELTPWLAGVYVVEDARRHGVGASLVRAIEAKAALLGYERLYLWTPSAERFYAGLGWQVHDRGRYLGEDVAVMCKDLTG